MMSDKGKIIWLAVGLPLLIGSTLLLSWSVLTRYAGQFGMSRASDASAGRLEQLQVGSEPPGFSVSDLAGRQVALAEFRHHKTVALYFWETECDLCVSAMPTLERLHHQFEDRAVEILAVNVGDDSDLVKRFSDRHKYTFRMVADENRTVGDLFRVGAIPALVVVDRNGRVMRTQIGDSSTRADELLGVLERLAQEPRSDTHAVAPPSSEGPVAGPDSAASAKNPGGASSGRMPSGMRMPKLVHKVEPTYTDEAREAKTQGIVLLSVEVREDGKPHNIRIIESLGYGLDENAIDAVEKWRFEPAQREGKAVRVTARIQVSFSLFEERATENL